MHKTSVKTIGYVCMTFVLYDIVPSSNFTEKSDASRIISHLFIVLSNLIIKYGTETSCSHQELSKTTMTRKNCSLSVQE